MTLFNLFFTTRIPDNLRYRSFTWPHLVLLLAVFACVFLLARHIKALEPDSREKMLKGFTLALPCIYIVKFAVFLLLEYFVEPQMSIVDMLPFHLCALNAIVMPIAVFKKNKTLLNYMYAIALPAAAAAMLTPAVSYYGRYFYFSWQILFFFIDHGLMTLVPVLAISSGLMRPDAKMLPRILLLFLAYSACIYAVNKLLGENFMFLNYPDEGTVMAFFAKYMGNPGYLAAMAALTAIIVVSMYLPWIFSRRRPCQGQECE